MISNLPNDILLEVADYLCQGTLNALTKTNHRLYNLLQNHLYSYNIQHDRGSSLAFAAAFGYAAVARKAIAQKANIDGKVPLPHAPGQSWHTALCFAIQNDHLPLVELLVENGANGSERCCHLASTPLVWATRHGHMELFNTLLDRGVNLDAHSLRGETAVMTAVSVGSVERLRILAQRGADVNMPLKDCRSPIRAASINGDKECVQVLLEHGARFECQDRYGIQAFVGLGGYNDSDEMLQFLLDNGASLEPKNDLLNHAAREGCFFIVDLLLRQGVSVEACEDMKTLHTTPLLLASLRNYVDIAKRLLDLGANINFAGDEWNRTPLFCAVYYGYPELVRLLLEYNPDLETYAEPHDRGQTALWTAVYQERWEIARLLTEKGADPNCPDTKKRRMPVWLAAKEGEWQLVELLLSEGADPNTWNRKTSLLLEAINRNNAAAVKMLLDKGANPHTKHRSMSMLSWAIQAGRIEVAEVLRQSGGTEYIKKKASWNR